MTEKHSLQTEDEQIEAYLQGLEPTALRRLIIEASWRDEGLRQKLRVAVAATGKKGLKSFRKAIKLATQTNGFLDWREAGSYASGLEDLAKLLENGISKEDVGLVELIEEAISLAEDALQDIDDSGGEVMPAIIELKKVHIAACTALRPDPVELAERLFEAQLNGAWDTFHVVLPDYAEALGTVGLKAYRQAWEDAWKVLPQLTPEDFRTGWTTQRFRIESAMEAIARYDNDSDLMVKIFAGNLSSPHRFLALGQYLHEHGRAAEALAWLEKGIAAFAGGRIDELLTLTIELQLELGNLGAAERLGWQRFEQAGNCQAFFDLMVFAEKVGRGPVLRKRALNHLWKCIEKEEAQSEKSRPVWEREKRGVLVSIYLREGNVDAMWEVFRGGAVETGLWSAVAEARGKTHHEDAIQVYKRLLPHVVESETRKARYHSAFNVVKNIRKLRMTHHQVGVFEGELAEIRLTWKQKRNFMKLLDAL